MKSVAECEDFASACERQVIAGCKVCSGVDQDCACRERYRTTVAAHEACIPRDFWNTSDKDVSHNQVQYKELVKPYFAKLKMARSKGYGLFFHGDNGVGKTMFLSMVLIRAIKARFTAYYTSLPELDHQIKLGFNNKDTAERLDWMLTSDFLAIDEMGKERYRDGDNFMRLQVERILKKRFDNSLPTLLASNEDLAGMDKMYGSTIASILGGKYRVVPMDSGDFRGRLRAKMNKDMS